MSMAVQYIQFTTLYKLSIRHRDHDVFPSYSEVEDTVKLLEFQSFFRNSFIFYCCCEGYQKSQSKHIGISALPLP